MEHWQTEIFIPNENIIHCKMWNVKCCYKNTKSIKKKQKKQRQPNRYFIARNVLEF